MMSIGERICCKTDRKTIVNFLMWAAGIIEGLEEKSTLMANRARIFRNIAKKIDKKDEKRA